MNHIESLTSYIGNFIDELAANGVTNVVISPGSRSTPLALLAAAHNEIKEHVLVDERSAAYFALGIAKETQAPVALICTSGTAVANYFPAVVEAYHGRVPLLLLTADRPHELRDIGAPQTIDQLNIFGSFVKKFYEMSLPEGSKESLLYVRNRAKRAVSIAMNQALGPVHLNFPIREPLTPDLSLKSIWGNRDKQIELATEKVLTNESVKYLGKLISSKKRPLIVVGPQYDSELRSLIYSLSDKLEAPILADPLSQIRSKKHVNLVEGYDAFLKDESLRQSLECDLIIRFGAMPISKSYLFYLREQKNLTHIVIDESIESREPTNRNSIYLHVKADAFLTQLNQVELEGTNQSWLAKWQKINQVTKDALSQLPNELTEGAAVKTLIDNLPDSSILFAGNSMAVRDVDSFYLANDKELFIHASRGASGIDGVVSTALGIASATEKQVTLLIGDLSFYHDLNGLLAAMQMNLNLTVLLINNDGGGIFSFLPQSNEPTYFEKIFGTPLGIDFSLAIEMYGGRYKQIKTLDELGVSLKESYRKQGLSVIEVVTNRKENVIWHQAIWQQIQTKINERLENDSNI